MTASTAADQNIRKPVFKRRNLEVLTDFTESKATSNVHLTIRPPFSEKARMRF